MVKSVLHYMFRGPIERTPGAPLVAGYSRNNGDGLPILPALTRDEVLAEAREAEAYPMFPHGHTPAPRRGRINSLAN